METQELIDNFEFFDDWEERYRYLIDLGRRLDPLDDAHRTADNKVSGCMSQVWFVADTDGPTVRFVADSDSAIVRGLIAVLLVVYSGRTRDEILATDIDDVFTQIGLDSHLSPNRRNGFYSMVQRIKTLAGA